MPVYIMANEMPYEEMQKWYKYFDTRPIGWREDFRTYLQLQQWGDKRKAEEIFMSLAAINKAHEEQKKKDTITLNTLKGSALFSRMLSAKGGEKLNYDKIEKV